MVEKQNVIGIIYCWTNTNTDKKYIGQTTHPEQRKRNHIHEAFVRGSDYYFHKSLRKHGLESFTYEVLEEADKNKLNDLENHYITLFNTIWPNGYNQGLNNALSEKSLNKMKESKIQKYNNMTDEERKEDVKKRNLTMSGKKQSNNQKKKAAEANQKLWEITLPNGETVTTRDVKKFCDEHGIKKSNLYNTYMGYIKKHKGYSLKQISSTCNIHGY